MIIYILLCSILFFLAWIIDELREIRKLLKKDRL